MAASNTDYFTEVGNPGTATTLAAPGHTIAGTTFNTVSTTNWPTATGVVFAVDTLDPTTGLRVAGSYTEWEGVVTAPTVISNATLRYGTDQNYSAGSTTRVYIPVASGRENRLAQGIQLFANQDGSLKTTAVQAALNISGGAAGGWTPLGFAPSAVVYNGNRSYTLTFSATDQTAVLSDGMRLRTLRTVAAPTQCTSLNGSTQFYSKASPSGMTFTNNFVVSAWIKVSSYAAGVIASRYNGTSGWALQLNGSGQLVLSGYNGGSGNVSNVTSSQSVPLNRWVHVAQQLDMATFTATSTTSYTMIDGIDAPAIVARIGSNPTALIQAGNLEIGSQNGGLLPFPGKIAQVAIYSAKVTEAVIAASITQGLSGTETSEISAYSFNNSINDLNTNANNLTANGSAVATNADSPFGGQAGGAISSTLDYGIIQSVVFSTNTTVVVQVAEGCTIPTSGGVTSISYSNSKVPYLFPAQRGKWRISCYVAGSLGNSTVTASGVWTPTVLNNFTIPMGEWRYGYNGSLQIHTSTSRIISGFYTLATSTPTTNVFNQEVTTRLFNGAACTDIIDSVSKEASVSLAAQTSYLMYVASDDSVSTVSYLIRGDQGVVELFAENAYV